MAIYVIGDVQGAYNELVKLVEMIAPSGEDRLWFVGDLVNRGPESAKVLRYVRGMGQRAVTVLGNHDLHLMAIAAGVKKPNKDDNCVVLLSEPDAQELLDWLRFRPLLHFDSARSSLLVHAGLLPEWTIDVAINCAREVEGVLRGTEYRELFREMYLRGPERWSQDLRGYDRYRLIINALTRLRYMHLDGRLCLGEKGRPGSQPNGLLPWFEMPERQHSDAHIYFGHWSALGRFRANGLDGVDTGCIWGGALTALEVGGEGRSFQVHCSGYCPIA